MKINRHRIRIRSKNATIIILDISHDESEEFASFRIFLEEMKAMVLSRNCFLINDLSEEGVETLFEQAAFLSNCNNQDNILVLKDVEIGGETEIFSKINSSPGIMTASSTEV